jgi:hypothetical protein
MVDGITRVGMCVTERDYMKRQEARAERKVSIFLLITNLSREEIHDLRRFFLMASEGKTS